jgi:AraC family transcriptional regulator
MDLKLAPEGTFAGSRDSELRDLVRRVVKLLDIAKQDLLKNRESAEVSITRASSLLRFELERSLPGGQRIKARNCLLTWQAQRVCDYIDANIGTRTLVCDLSAIAQRSNCHFARAFKRTFGQSPHNYLIRRRLELASHMMLVTDAPLSEIALSCGFSDQPHLCRHFRRYFGQSPAAWRRDRANGGDRYKVDRRDEGVPRLERSSMHGLDARAHSSVVFTDPTPQAC